MIISLEKAAVIQLLTPLAKMSSRVLQTEMV